MYLILYKNNKVVYRAINRMKSQIFKALASTSHDKGYIRVTYERGYYNDSEHTNDEDLLSALNTYTEMQMLDYVEKTEPVSM